MTNSDVKVAAAIGMATMLPDGTIQLDLQANMEGRHGSTRVVYPKSHPSYADVLRHLGGMKPGETKLVPPWD